MKDLTLHRQIEKVNTAGKEAELNNDIKAAIKYYEENVKAGHADQYAYDRLMILYRKQKEYKNELRVISKGIKVFKEQSQNQLKGTLSNRRNKKQLIELSNIFMSRSGLKDKKGNHTYFPEPVNKWLKRKVLVERKIESMK
ncbi:MAG: hypothetical protein WKF97_11220 [Chitinophagaceae bacterium]